MLLRRLGTGMLRIFQMILLFGEDRVWGHRYIKSKVLEIV